MTTPEPDAEQDSALLLPIGRYLGVVYPKPGGTDDETAEHHHVVSLGPEIHQLTDAQFQLWAHAHGQPDQLTERIWTAEAALESAAKAGVERPYEQLRTLTRAQLVIEVNANLEDIVYFGYEHQLFPLMLGLGNTAENPTSYAAGFINRPMVGMNSIVYDVFGWAQLDNNLWDACQNSAEAARRAGRTAPVETNAEQILVVTMRSLHPMLASAAGYLDRARATGPAGRTERTAASGATF